LNSFTFLDYGKFTSKKETTFQMVYTPSQAQTLLIRCALWKRRILSRYTCNCDVICAHKKKYSFLCADLSESHKCQTALRAAILYSIWPNRKKNV